MGADSSKSDNFSVPELFYVHRKKSRILHIAQGKVNKLNFSKPIKIRQDSAIGFLNRRKILVCGGSDSAGCLTNDTLIIDPVHLKSKIATSLPCPCAGGHIFEHSDWAYYIGCITEGDVEEDESEVPGPIMRYHLREHRWEVVKDKKKKEEEFNITDLLQPRAFLHMNKLYLYGGQIRGKNGKFKNNFKFFSLNLAEANFVLKKENFQLPKKLKNPSFINRGSDVVVVGGSAKKVWNLECFSFSFVNRVPEFKQEPQFVLENIDDHPECYTGVCSVIFNFPEVAFLENKSETWKKISIIQKTGEKPTPELNKVLSVEKLKKKEKGKQTKKPERNRRVKDDEDSEEEKANPLPKTGSQKKKPAAFEYESDG